MPLLAPGDQDLQCLGLERTKRDMRRGRRFRQSKAAQQQAQQQAAAQAEQRETATEEQLENFKNAFSVCLEAKDYMVKF